jgi:hypothetical protein
MNYISHRGNINGKIVEKENSTEYIDEAIKLGYDVEIDVWMINDILYLGHDEPQYEIEIEWLEDRIDELWIHCKNFEALCYFQSTFFSFAYFWHQNDDFTFTKNGYIWTYPGKKLEYSSICVLPETVNYTDEELEICAGICSDYIEDYKKNPNI